MSEIYGHKSDNLDPTQYNKLWDIDISLVNSFTSLLKAVKVFARLIATGRVFHKRTACTEKEWLNNWVLCPGIFSLNSMAISKTKDVSQV